jgi:hypothetical protein
MHSKGTLLTPKIYFKKIQKNASQIFSITFFRVLVLSY